MKRDFIVRRSITMIDGKPHVETYSEQELVRCKDCAYAIFKENVVPHGHIVCTKPFTERWQIVKPDDWFCADGKRKELEGEA